MHKTSLPHLRRHAFQPETPLLDNFPAQPSPCTPPPDPAQPPPDLTHSQHTHVSSTCRTHVPITGIPCWRSLPLIPSPPAHIPSFNHACTTAAPHQQHHATHTIPPPRRTRLSHAGVTSRYHPLCVSFLQDVIDMPPPPCGDISASGPWPPECQQTLRHRYLRLFYITFDTLHCLLLHPCDAPTLLTCLDNTSPFLFTSPCATPTSPCLFLNSRYPLEFCI
jgi:hypothetical protein